MEKSIVLDSYIFTFVLVLEVSLSYFVTYKYFYFTSTCDSCMLKVDHFSSTLIGDDLVGICVSRLRALYVGRKLINYFHNF